MFFSFYLIRPKLLTIILLVIGLIIFYASGKCNSENCSGGIINFSYSCTTICVIYVQAQANELSDNRGTRQL